MYTLDFLAGSVSLIAAGFMSSGNPKYMPIVMCLYILGSCLWIGVGVQAALYGMVATNVGFIVLEVIGLYKWLNLNKKEKKAVDTLIKK